MARGFPQRQHQVRVDRDRRRLGAGRGLVQWPVLGVVLPAAGFQSRQSYYRLYRRSWTDYRHPNTDHRRLAVRPHRPQAGDLRRYAACGRDVLSAVLVARFCHAAGNINMPIAIIIVAILVAYVGMVYGPIGAFLAEFFPSRIRYTSVSVPYHIGNGWGGGLVPFITTAAYLNTGSLGWALAYPIAVPAVMFLIAIFVMPETRKHSIWEEGAIEAARSRA